MRAVSPIVGRNASAGAVVAMLAAGCGGAGGGAPGRDRAERLVPAPAAVLEACRDLASGRALAVLCPAALPRERWSVIHRTLRSGRAQYLLDLETRPAQSGDPSHVLAGGRRGLFSLRTVAAAWPAVARIPRDLGLVGARPLRPGERRARGRPVRLRLVRRATVRRRPALLLRAAEHPDGGVHGDHVALVWNEGGDGYVLSMHFGRRRDADEQATVLLRTAAAMRRLPGVSA